MLRYVLWNVAIAAASSITCLSWSRNAVHSWNIAQPEGLDAQMPAFPFTSLKARILAALLLALMFGFFILYFILSFQLGHIPTVRRIVAAESNCVRLQLELFLFSLLVSELDGISIAEHVQSVISPTKMNAAWFLSNGNH